MQGKSLRESLHSMNVGLNLNLICQWIQVIQLTI